MQVGLLSMNSGMCGYSEAAMRITQRAEAAGFESLWAGEHIVLPDPQEPLPSDIAAHPLRLVETLAHGWRGNGYRSQPFLAH
ncbi:MAG TPA: hypothetical protein VFU63_10990, partial [Ktedonobacterales bacterium]|nr:hypothetical protein [Ktedonobacterales bacterium]